METMSEALSWVGRAAQDPWDAPLGTIVAVVPDVESGAPEWLVIAPEQAATAGGASAAVRGAEDSTAAGEPAEGALAPVRDAEPTGARNRVAATAPLLAQAPRLRVGERLAPADRAAARARYGIGPGGARRIEAVESPPREGRHRTELAPERRRALIDALQSLHAREQAELRELAAMRWRARDEELVHDLALHHKETNRHAAMIRTRLAQLGGRPSWRRDAAARAAAHLAAQPPRLRRHPEAHDAAALLAHERRQAEAWEQVERLSRESGDERTAALADAIAADERAMAARLAANWEASGGGAAVSNRPAAGIGGGDGSGRPST
ncbi:DUF892 family protein [Conexibacter arvalis]|uniref:Ferritin-like metal-binding protein YciE n=1 Tax=Conexibacter arvalis TaxID=912552 RepID=A0A840IBY3_9ACTN|nr:DUF892 family protein [Conexibacter arvalis]MBB4662399.1 ferritin-like metal-binding protein YciE [Conexibacter arvalis]